MGTATYLNRLDHFRGDARVFAMDPPLHGEFATVVVSAATIAGRPETYIFPANDAGDDVEDWGELPGSQKDTLSHQDVLSDLGYEIVGMGELPERIHLALDRESESFVSIVDAMSDVLGYQPGDHYRAKAASEKS